jgi:hypothetical protein
MMMLQTTVFAGDPGPVLGDSASAFIYFGLKALFIVGAMIYLIFAFVVTRQIHVMKSTVITPQSGVMTLLGLAHLLLAFGVLLLFIMIL